MSLADNKRDVFNKISSYVSFMKQVKPITINEIYPSINNSDDIIPFLLDSLKSIAGTESLKEIIGSMLSDFINDAEVTAKSALIKQFTQFNSGENFPTNIINNGIDLPLKNIDTKGKLKINPYSDAGKLIYNNLIPNFDTKVYNALSNEGNTYGYFGMAITYNNVSDSINIKPTGNTNIGNFFINYINNSEIINKDELVTNIMDVMFGVFSKKTEKNINEVLQDLETQQLLIQAINGDNSFELNIKTFDELQKKAKQISSGITTYDMGCGFMEVSLSFNSLNNLITTISGTTDPFIIGNAIENTIIESSSGNTTTETIVNNNKETIRDGFFQKIIEIFTTQILQAVVGTPQIRSLMALMSALQNNGNILISNAKDDMKLFKTLIMCLINNLLSKISEFIFNLVIGYLVALLLPVAENIIKEKINQYKNIITSLLPIKLNV